MLDFVTQNALAASILGTFVAGGLWAVYRHFRSKKARRQCRELIIFDQEGRGVPGCRAVNLRFRTCTEDLSDNTGSITIPSNWPNKMRLGITKRGQLLGSVSVDFSREAKQTVVVPLRSDNKRSKAITTCKHTGYESATR